MRTDTPTSPGGLVHISQWGSLRHAANVALVCLMASQLDLDKGLNEKFSLSQLNYMLGLGTGGGGHSFMVGFGVQPPERAHHAGSSCPSPPLACGWAALSSPGPNPQVLEGALVGGPQAPDDGWEDDRENYVGNEVTLDYNAGFTSLLAGIIELKTFI